MITIPVYNMIILPNISLTFKKDFFDEENRPFFYIGNENHGEYIETLEQLLPGMIPKYKENISFIVNYMLFKTDYVKELLEKVAKSAVEGSSWWEKILYSIRSDYINESGFSEFETYGNYVMKYHFGEYSLRSISQYRTVNRHFEAVDEIAYFT